ncbi:hypothetical protein WQ54_19310 [Bacillus sp. SA1-12]|uniref:hypothetical protein n=1 Tax=Bacillus sp. SA1-12 TaxID=1455638 RepID=UPI00062730CC|nr:hypothetical protein [Bacillus sp. SA1-12]KKI90671.1 hypothetical protein WQ54_19310 [Bacillus sp. SA1-12]
MKKELNIFNCGVRSDSSEAFNSSIESHILLTSTENKRKLLNESIDKFPFNLNQKIKVITPDNNSYESEDYYYIIDFAEKEGTISKIYSGEKISYLIKFNNGREGIFYHDDLILINDI